MFDLKLRPAKEAALSGPARTASRYLSPNQLSSLGLFVTAAAAGAAAGSYTVASVLLWLASRALDGLDGTVARARGSSSDLGGYTDQLFDTVGYTLVPLGLAIGLDSKSAWIGVALLLGSFYINSVSWMYLSAILEKRGLGASANHEFTSVTMPSALIEGAETIVFFSLFLLIPNRATELFIVMAVAVSVTAGQRAKFAHSVLQLAEPNEVPERL